MTALALQEASAFGSASTWGVFEMPSFTSSGVPSPAAVEVTPSVRSMGAGFFRLWKRPAAVGYGSMAYNEQFAKTALSSAQSVPGLLAIPAFRDFIAASFRSQYPPRYEEIADPEDDSVVRSLVVHTSLSVDEAVEAKARLRRTLRGVDRNELLRGLAISLRFAE